MGSQPLKSRRRFPSEADFTAMVVPHLVNCGFAVHLEVGAVTRSIDAVLVDEQGATTALEFKIRDWRRALVQARDHQVLCDRAAICMPRRRPTDELFDALQASGIGYIGYDMVSDDIEMVVAPQASSAYWDTAGDALRERLRTEDGR